MRLPRDLSGRALAAALGRVGYEGTRQTGSHIRLTRRPTEPRIGASLDRAILKESGSGTRYLRRAISPVISLWKREKQDSLGQLGAAAMSELAWPKSPASTAMIAAP